MNDTSPDIEKKIQEMMSSKTPSQRLNMMGSMFDAAKILIRSNLLSQNPSLTEGQIRARTFLQMYRQDFSDKQIKKIINGIPNMQLDNILDKS